MRYEIERGTAAHELARASVGTQHKKGRATPMRRALMSGAACYLSLVPALLLSGTETPAVASGFALREQSAAALGNAFAGATAAADDIGSMFFNPA
ncbi:MAG: outer membrane protein transport protein, partial [Candidatus Binatia bacterium]